MVDQVQVYGDDVVYCWETNRMVAFDRETVEELMRDECELEVEQRCGEGWTVQTWAERFLNDGYDVA